MPNHPETLPSPCRTMLPQTKKMIEDQLAGTVEKLEGFRDLTNNDGDLNCRQLRDGLLAEAAGLRNLLSGAVVVGPPIDPQKVEGGTKFTVRFGTEEGSRRFVFGYSLADVAHYPKDKDEAVLSGRSFFGEAVFGKGPGETFEYDASEDQRIKGTIVSVEPIPSI